MPDTPLDLSPGDETDLLAAEFVLGLLDGDAYRAAVRRSDDDSAFAAAVTAWEQRLTALALRAESVEPRGDLWPAIVAALPMFATDRRRWWDSVALWRATTAAASIAAVALAVVALRPAPPPQQPPTPTQVLLASTPMRGGCCSSSPWTKPASAWS